MSRRSLISTLILSLLVSYGSYAGTVVRVGLPAKPATLDPHMALTRADHILARELFVGLTALDAEGKVIAGLAENWTISPDRLVYTFALRDNLTWSDGQSLDATTVVKSIERALDPATNAPFAAQLLSIKNAEAFRLGILPNGEKLGVVARDRRTVEFRLANPSQRFLQLLAQPVASPVPLHRLKNLKQAWAQAETVIGNGAFTFVSQAEKFSIAKNPRFYAATSVALDSVEFLILPTGDAAADALKANTIDLAVGFTPAPHVGRPAIAGLVEGDAVASYQLSINVSHPPFDKREFRHALGMVIDRADVVKTLRLAGAEPAFSLVPTPPYSPVRSPYARLDRADRNFVAEALLLDVDIPSARPFRFVVPRGAAHQSLAEAIAKYWTALGFKVELLALDEATFESAILSGDFDVAVNIAWHQANSVDAMLSGYSQSAGPWNLSGYRELEFDQLMITADTELDAENYPSHLRQAEGVLIEDQVSWPMLFYPANVIARAKLNGLAANSAQIHPLRYLAPQ